MHRVVLYAVLTTFASFLFVPFAWTKEIIRIDGDKAYLNPICQNKVICFDIAKRRILWETAGSNWGDVFSGGKDSLLARTLQGEPLILNVVDGSTAARLELKTFGSPFAIDSEGRIFCGLPEYYPTTITCLSARDHKVVWRYSPGIPDTSNNAQYCGGFVFVTVWPTKWDSSRNDSVSPTNSCKVVCLRSADGKILWENKPRPVDFCDLSIPDSSGHTVLAENDRSIAYAHHRLLLLMDKGTGQILHCYQSEREISNLAFWEPDRLVVFGGDYKFQPMQELAFLRIFSLKDWSVLSEVSVRFPKYYLYSQSQVQEIHSYGDTLYVKHCKGTAAIDLKNLSVTWSRSTRYSIEISGGKLYSMDWEDEFGARKERSDFGILDPKSGKKQILFECNRLTPSLSTATLARERAMLSAPDFPKTKTISGKCPYGHHALRDVPILYGLMIGGPDSEKAIRDLRFVWGGCLIGEKKSQVICATCRATLDRKTKVWSWHSCDETAFSPPFTELVRGFPQDLASTSVLKIFAEETQESLIPLNSHWISQKVEFGSIVERDKLQEKIVRFLKRQGVTCSAFVRDVPAEVGSTDQTVSITQRPLRWISFYKNPYKETLTGQWKGLFVRVVTKPSNPNTTWVNLSLRREEFKDGDSEDSD